MKMYRSSAAVEVRIHRNQTYDEGYDERYLDNQSKSNQFSNHKINNTCILLKKKNFDITAKDIQNDLEKKPKNNLHYTDTIENRPKQKHVRKDRSRI